MLKQSILFYDGDCALCNHTVQFIISHEKKAEKPLLFCPLQSNFAKEVLSKYQYNFSELSTLVLLKEETISYKSNAALNVCPYLKLPYTWLISLKIIPRFIRDIAYDFIAKQRKKIIKQSYCFVPTADLRQRFLE